MSTPKKSPAPVTNKRGVNTREVPARTPTTGRTSPAPAKKSAPVKAVGPAKAAVPVKSVKVVVHGVKQTPKGPASSKKTVTLNKTDSAAVRAAKSPKEQAKIVGKVALKTATLSKSAPQPKPGQLKGTVVLKKDIAKIAQATVTKVNPKAKKDILTAVKKTGADTKGYKEGTAAGHAAAVTKRASSNITKFAPKVIPVTVTDNSKAAPAKKPKAAAMQPAKSATRGAASAAKNTTSAPASSPAGSSGKPSYPRGQTPAFVHHDHAPFQQPAPAPAPVAAPAAAAPKAIALPPADSNYAANLKNLLRGMAASTAR